MTRVSRLILQPIAIAIGAVAIGCMGHTDRVNAGDSDKQSQATVIAPDSTVTTDSVAAEISPASWEGGKARMPDDDESVRYKTLTDADFDIVAKELNVEVAAIKAVVRIEAGAAMEGFWAPGVPIVNFDRSMYNIYAKKAANKAGDKSAKVPAGLTGFALRKWTTLTNMRKINRDGADMGTFWGMFQIGGFAYKSCGCESVRQMVELMSRSEFDQLELFAAFVLNTGYVDYIRKKDWAGFSRRYNGPNYAKRGYHKKMAAAYAKFKKS